MVRTDEPDVVFTHQAAKRAALVAEIARVHASGRPVLVGTASVGESEDLAAALVAAGVRCQVLNARNDESGGRDRRAGRRARRRSPSRRTWPAAGPTSGSAAPTRRAAPRWWRTGGLYVIGTNRHASLRIDQQLRGRAGRQGDPGCSRFFVSLEDPLIRRYGVEQLVSARHLPARQDAPVEIPPAARRDRARPAHRRGRGLPAAAHALRLLRRRREAAPGHPALANGGAGAG